MKRMKQKNTNTSLNDILPFSNDGQSFFEWPPPPQHWHTNVGQFEVLCSAIFWQRLHSNKSIAYDLVISSPVNDCSPYSLAFDLDLLEYWKESKVAVAIFWHYLNSSNTSSDEHFDLSISSEKRRRKYTSKAQKWSILGLYLVMDFVINFHRS